MTKQAEFISERIKKKKVVPRYRLSRLDKLIPSEWQAPNFMVIIIVIISSINLRRPPILRTAYPYHLVRES